MRRLILIFTLIVIVVAGFYLFRRPVDLNTKETNTSMENSNPKITPISHATMVLNWNDKNIYTDPVGSDDLFMGQPAPDIILLSDIHQDHLNADRLKALSKETTLIIAPKAVADMLPVDLKGTVKVMNNGEKFEMLGFKFEAIPMYNVPESPDAYHTKGRGNGYVVEADGKRVYISGDTANTPELRALQNIDMAFVSMNLPWTMSVEDAAEAVLAFKPKQVTPYHYRGSDINKFKELVNAKDSSIEVRLMEFYP